MAPNHRRRFRGSAPKHKSREYGEDDESLPTGWDVNLYSREIGSSKGTGREVAYENSKAMMRFEKDQSDKEQEIRHYVARKLQREINRLKSEYSYVSENPQSGQYTILSRPGFVDPEGLQANENGLYLFNNGRNLIRLAPKLPFHVSRPQDTARFDQPNRAQRRAGIVAVKERYEHLNVDHGPIYSSHGNWMVDFEMPGDPPTSDGPLGWKHFTSLPKPDLIEVSLLPSSDRRVTYTWSKSRISRNKLEHSLHGNGPECPLEHWARFCAGVFTFLCAAALVVVAQWAISHAAANRLMHALNGNGPGVNADKTCNSCGKKGHIQKDCNKNKRSSGGAKNKANKAMASSMADLSAQAKAAADVSAGKTNKEEPPEYPKKPVAWFNMGTQRRHTFDVPVDEPVTYKSWIRLAIVFRFLLPLCLAFFAFDLGVYPHLCLKLADLASVVNLTFWTPVFVGLMLLENFFVGYVVFYCKYYFSKFIVSLSYRHRISVMNCEADEAMIQEDDRRPIDCTFGPRLYKSGFGSMTVSERIYLTNRYWNVHLYLGQRTIIEGTVSTTAFTLFGSTVTTNRSLAEFSDAVRRNLSKCSKIDWDAEIMVKQNVMEHTCVLLEYVKRHVSGYHDTSLDLDLLSEQPLFAIPPWVFTRYGLLYISTCTFILVYFGLSFLAGFANAFWQAFLFLHGWVTFGVEFSHVSASSVYGYMYDGSTAFSAAYEGMKESMANGTYGYRVSDSFFQDVDLNDADPMKMLNFTQLFGDSHLKMRDVMGVFSPFAIPGIAMPMVDRNDFYSAAAGLIHRGAALTPNPLPSWTAVKKRIVDEICDRHFPVLCDSDLLHFDDMLSATKYTLTRKQQIKDWHKGRRGDYQRPLKNGVPDKNKTTSMFNKEEPYQELKQARSIQGMHRAILESDVWGSVGRLVHTAQKTVYDLAPSVKHLTPQGIVDKLLSLGPGSKTVSDYSSYEASFKEVVKEAAQFRLYDHLTQGLSGFHMRLRGHLRWVLGRTVNMKSKYFNAVIKNLKCSGDFDTALSNWFDNVASWLTVFQVRHGVHWTDAINWILCEGDDNITDDHGYGFCATDFANLGMKAKIQTGLELVEAGFCQKFVNTSTGTLVGDVLTFLGKRQYLPAMYRKASLQTKYSLARATAMSTLSTFPNAPGISEWAWAVLQQTSTITVRAAHMFYEDVKYGRFGDHIQTAFVKPVIRLADRIMVSRVFGFDLRQQQILTDTLASWGGGNLMLPKDW